MLLAILNDKICQSININFVQFLTFLEILVKCIQLNIFGEFEIYLDKIHSLSGPIYNYWYGVFLSSGIAMVSRDGEDLADTKCHTKIK